MASKVKHVAGELLFSQSIQAELANPGYTREHLAGQLVRAAGVFVEVADEQGVTGGTLRAAIGMFGGSLGGRLVGGDENVFKMFAERAFEMAAALDKVFAELGAEAASEKVASYDGLAESDSESGEADAEDAPEAVGSDPAEDARVADTPVVAPEKASESTVVPTEELDLPSNVIEALVAAGLTTNVGIKAKMDAPGGLEGAKISGIGPKIAVKVAEAINASLGQ